MVKRRTLTAALLLGGLSAGSCLVYDKGDLPKGEAVGGGSGRGGAGMAGGTQSGGTSGSGSGGTSGGLLGGGSDAAGEGGSGASDAVGGGGGEAGEGQAGAPPSGGSGGTGAVSGTSGGGTGGTLGAGSGGGGVPGAAGTVTWAPELIDNSEDLDNQLLPHEMRNGYWFTLSDGTAKATLSPVTGMRQWMTALAPTEQTAMNKAALEVRMAGFDTLPPDGWGAGAGFNFRAPVAVYDASKFAGISFVAKASAALLPFEVKIALKGTVLGFGVCTASPPAQLCGNHPVKPLMLSTSWARYDLKWSEFVQDASWGKQVPFAPAELVSVQFIVPPPGSNNAVFSIDDVKFLVAPQAASVPAEAP